jgi:small subunit ribosomal protein S2
MQELRAMQAAGDFDGMPKREALQHTRELEKLSRNLGGIANLDRLPNAVFVIDTKKEHIAVTEARKLGLPVVAVVDTNCDPDVIDYVIPGNDDAIRSGSLMCRVIADAVVEGRFIAEHRRAMAPPAPEDSGPSSAPRPRRAQPAPAPTPTPTPEPVEVA